MRSRPANGKYTRFHAIYRFPLPPANQGDARQDLILFSGSLRLLPTVGVKLSPRVARVDGIPTQLNQDKATRLGIANQREDLIFLGSDRRCIHEQQTRLHCTNA